MQGKWPHLLYYLSGPETPGLLTPPKMPACTWDFSVLGPHKPHLGRLREISQAIANSPSSPVEEEVLLVSVNTSSLGRSSKGPREVGPSDGVGSELGGSATGVAVWLEEASGCLSVGSSLSSSIYKRQSESSVP